MAARAVWDREVPGSNPGSPTYMVYIYLFLSILGFLDSTYLTIKHYSKDPLSCPVFGGCNEVTNSIYSEIFGIPIALFGAIYYAAIFFLSLYSFLGGKKIFLKVAGFLTIFGFLTSVYLVYIMVFVLNAICFYCIVSAITSSLLFITFIVNWLSWKKNPV